MGLSVGGGKDDAQVGAEKWFGDPDCAFTAVAKCGNNSRPNGRARELGLT